MRAEYQRSCEAMGTRFEIFLRGADEQHLEDVAIAALEEIIRLDGVLSQFDPRSEIARVNREAAKKTVRVDRELFALLEACEQARHRMNGYFDVTQGGGWELDAANCTVRLATAEAQIDLGGVGKGYALDRGREILRRFQVADALLQGGTSSVLAVGGKIWPIDLRHPTIPDVIAARIELVNRGLSCSAVRHAEQESSDVVNPLTGAPLVGDAACVVLAASAAEAEIYSTALLAMGRETAEQYLANRDVTVGWIDADFSWLKKT